MDAQSGQVLFEKNMHLKLYPASITKILTVLLGVERGQMQDRITMSREAVYSIKRGSSHIALQEGEEITLEQALMAAMLPSANDASNGIAEHIGGSITEFARLMNQRAIAAGAVNSNFVNPHGLPDERQVTTAYDMALISREALKNDKFRQIFATMRYTIPPTNKQTEPRDLWSEHRMLTTNRYRYDGLIGGKTGYTRESQNTLVSAARRGDRELIVVVMRSMGYADYRDTIALFDYGFNDFIEASILPPSPASGYGGAEEVRVIQDVLQQNQGMSIKRLIHKDTNPGDIAVYYQLVVADPNKQPGLKMNIHLRSASTMMSADLGSVYLANASPVKTTWTAPVLKSLKLASYTGLGTVTILFLLRWFFKAHRGLRHKKSLSP